MMKRVLSAALAICVALGTTACGEAAKIAENAIQNQESRQVFAASGIVYDEETQTAEKNSENDLFLSTLGQILKKQTLKDAAETTSCSENTTPAATAELKTGSSAAEGLYDSYSIGYSVISRESSPL